MKTEIFIQHSKQNGFTIIQTVIALAIFATIARMGMMYYQSQIRSEKNSKFLKLRNKTLDKINKSFRKLESCGYNVAKAFEGIKLTEIAESEGGGIYGNDTFDKIVEFKKDESHPDGGVESPDPVLENGELVRNVYKIMDLKYRISRIEQTGDNSYLGKFYITIGFAHCEPEGTRCFEKNPNITSAEYNSRSVQLWREFNFELSSGEIDFDTVECIKPPNESDEVIDDELEDLKEELEEEIKEVRRQNCALAIGSSGISGAEYQNFCSKDVKEHNMTFRETGRTHTFPIFSNILPGSLTFTLIAGGGGGGGSGNRTGGLGGKAGELSKIIINTSDDSVTSCSITVGGGGLGGQGGTGFNKNGKRGGDSSVRCGSQSKTAQGGEGGEGAGNTSNRRGMSGEDMWRYDELPVHKIGTGGAERSATDSQTGHSATGIGAAGGGASIDGNEGKPGGRGAPGIVYVRWYSMSTSENCPDGVQNDCAGGNTSYGAGARFDESTCSYICSCDTSALTTRAIQSCGVSGGGRPDPDGFDSDLGEEGNPIRGGSGPSYTLDTQSCTFTCN